MVSATVFILAVVAAFLAGAIAGVAGIIWWGLSEIL
ncbi:hypothetical protein CPT_Maja_095 [Burkholderia phage Maja]|uniref:Uncharacterized protein n=1 Tax=Burkholderia phage Maja TaxID=2767571 RepID=A0A7S6U3P6_9CAUD|nr:hypothetical protein CPT_Maja_095 [Burkholderia phage Maja]